MSRQLHSRIAASLALGTLVSAMAAQQASAVVMNVNLARTGTASQSSTDFGGNASFAIDGGLGISYGLDATTSHTANIANSSWQVNLGSMQKLNSVQLYNRGDCCPERLGNFTLSVLDNSNNTVFSQVVASSVGLDQTFALPGVTGQTVKVQLNGVNNLNDGFVSLREVVVMGEANVVNSSNLARLYGTATQSNTLDNGARPAAHKAIDGNTDGNFGVGSTTHTAGGSNAFWEVDLNSTFHIDNIRLFNRTDCCGDRLSNYDIQILDEDRNVVSTIVNNGGPGTGFHAVAPGAQGRFVRVQIDGLNIGSSGQDILSLAEVQVFGGGLQNVARNPLAVATQSTTDFGGLASRAIDGITDGVYFSSNSVTHTATSANPFWNLDLGNDFDIDEIILFNREEGLQGRLSGAQVRLFNEGGQELFLANLGDMTGINSFRIDINNIRARSLQVLLPGNDRVLSLAEVQVFGVASIPEPATFGLLGLAAAGLMRRRRRLA